MTVSRESGAAWTPSHNRLVGLVVKASASRADVSLAMGFSGSSHTSDLNWHSSGYPARRQALNGSELGLVGLVSVCCDWVR